MSFLQILYDADDPEQKQVPITLSVLNSQEDSLPQITKSELIYDKNEDTSNVAAEWNDRETKYLLKKYNKYIMLTGRSKQIRTKRELWLHIARDMKNDLKVPKSAAQCENRYKTLLRRWRRRKIIEQETADPVIDANDQNETSTSAVNESKESLKTILLEIFKQKEENRERRHKEKMELIKKLIESI